MKWAKSRMMTSCDVLLVDRINEKFNELDLYEQGGVTYIKIALDEMFTISNIVVATLHGFFEAFKALPRSQMRISVLLQSRSLPLLMRSQVKVPAIFLKGSLGALLSFLGILLHICWKLSNCNSFVI